MTQTFDTTEQAVVKTEVSAFVADFIGAVSEMRSLQREYFARRDKDALTASKRAERRVDALLRLLREEGDEDPQGRLF